MEKMTEEEKKARDALLYEQDKEGLRVNAIIAIVGVITLLAIFGGYQLLKDNGIVTNYHDQSFTLGF